MGYHWNRRKIITTIEIINYSISRFVIAGGSVHAKSMIISMPKNPFTLKYSNGYSWYTDMAWTHGYPFVFIFVESCRTLAETTKFS